MVQRLANRNSGLLTNCLASAAVGHLGHVEPLFQERDLVRLPEHDAKFAEQ